MSREELRQRLGEELGDIDVAANAVAGLDDAVVAGLVERSDGDIAGASILSYRPPTVADDRIDSIWILAFGYRFSTGRTATSGVVPPMTDLEPGPVNEALATEAAALAARFPVPIIAQWETARVLHELGVVGVISVEPDRAADGSVSYLSTSGVLRKGLQLAADAGLSVGRAGVLGHADHVCRCLATAEAVGMDAAVPAGVDLPTAYDPESGQEWTRSRASYIPVDLMARSLSADGGT